MFSTISFFIIIALVISFGIAFYQYLYNNKNKKSITTIVLFVLRFLTVFLLLLLLINPKIKKENIEVVKPSLAILVDNTKSIKELKRSEEVVNIVDAFKNSKLINDKFELDFYTFSDDISINDSLNFNKTSTNISKALQSVEKIYKNKISPIIVISDGNQTHGNDYSNLKWNKNIFPIIIGDTLGYQDIYISQLNVNKYAYLKNKFPVEIFVNYNGDKKVISKLTITDGNIIVFSKKIKLTSIKNSKQIEFFIPANSVGVHNYKARLSVLKNEKNIINNKKNLFRRNN